ncbi:MAG: amino acid permease [Eubacterium sp.]|nr:amino acid permease [Eubacterium sp.]
MESLGRKTSLSRVEVWALAFGSIIGWGAFVMPGSTFLPYAGPFGSGIALGLGAMIMCLIAFNFKYMMNRYPSSGGPFLYTSKVFGYDHGFVCAWFLGLSYIAIIPQNATALTLILRTVFGKVFQFGFHYQVAGYDIWLGEILFSLLAILAVAGMCYNGGRLVGMTQAVLAIILLAGVVVITVSAFFSEKSTISHMSPAFANNDRSKISQVLMILSAMPWAFVGFDTIAQSVERFRFPVKKSQFLMILAILLGAGVYVSLTLVTASTLPEGYDSWLTYLAETGNFEGLKAIPLFGAADELMGQTGIIVLTLSALSAALTGMIGFFLASTRMLSTMAEKRILPDWYRKGGEMAPRNVIIFIGILSMSGPLIGRTALGWLVDISSLGAAIGFAYTSFATFRVAKKEGSKGYRIVGISGLVLSVLFAAVLLVPGSLDTSVLEPESYLSLGVWAAIGFVLYWATLRRHEIRVERKHAMTVGVILLLIEVFSMTVWMLQSIHRTVKGVTGQPGVSVEEMRKTIHGKVVGSVIVYSILLVVTLLALLATYYTMHKQTVEMEAGKLKAEEGSRMKSEFLSNMSHDIRTPMNAIIGYTDLARENLDDPKKTGEYLDKIYFSGQHLLDLINDVLEMSRIESGRIEFDESFYDIRAIFDHLDSMIRGQAEAKNITLRFEIKEIRHYEIYCDRLRLNQIFLNLIGNAIKFTPEGGEVVVSAEEHEDLDELHANYELRVKDNGIGMTDEFARHVFEPFERERTSTVSGVQGTGLGMAITKNIVELMHGMIDLVTRPGHGTEFIIHIPFRRKSRASTNESGDVVDARKVEAVDTTPDEKKWDFSGRRALLVDDNMINREIAKAVLDRFGFSVEEATDGDEAVAKVELSVGGYYDVVLMDIQMPRMNGHDATRAIRALENPALAQTPVVAMTANAFEEDVKKAEAAGMNAHVAKPIDIPNLMATLQEVLSR